MKRILFSLLFLGFVSFAYSQEDVPPPMDDYGTFIVYKNPKYMQYFTVEKMNEIQTEVEARRQDYKEVRWDITEYTYIIIKPRYTQAASSTSNVEPSKQ